MPKAKTIGRLGVVVGLDISQLTKGVKSAGMQVKSFNRTMGGMAAGISGAVAAMAGFRVLGKSVATASNLEQALSHVRARTRASADTMAELTAAARELGRTTQFTSTEAAQGMELIARNGFKAKDAIVAITREALNLASVDGLEGGISKSSDILTKLMRQYNLNFDEASRIADTMAISADNAATSVGELFRNMEISGAQARALGMDLKTAAAWQAEISDLRGERRAGTSLRAMLGAMSAPTEKAKEAMRQLKTESGEAFSFLDKDGNFKDLLTIIKEFEFAFKDMSEGQIPEILADMFEQEGLSTLMAVLKAGTDKVESNLGKVANAWHSANSEAQEMASIRLDNVLGGLTRLKSATEHVMESFSLPMLPFFKEVIDSVKVGMQTFSKWAAKAGVSVTNLMRETLNGSGKALPTLIRMGASLTAIGASAIAAGAAFRIMAFGVGIASTAFHALRGAAYASLTAATAVAGVSMMATLGVSVLATTAALWAFHGVLIKISVGFVAMIAKGVGAMLAWVATGIATLAAQGAALMARLAAAIAVEFAAIVSTVGAGIAGVFANLANMVVGLIGGVARLAALMAEVVFQAIAFVAELVAASAAEVMGALVAGFQMIATAIASVVGTMLTGLASAIPIMLGIAAAGIGAFLFIAAAAGALFLATEDGVAGLKLGWQSLKENVSSIIRSWQGAFKAMFDLALQLGKSFFAALGIDFDATADGVGSTWKSMMANLGVSVTKLGMYVRAIAKDWRTVSDVANAAWDSVWANFKVKGFLAMGHIANWLIEKIGGALEWAAEKLASLGEIIEINISLAALAVNPLIGNEERQEKMARLHEKKDAFYKMDPNDGGRLDIMADLEKEAKAANERIGKTMESVHSDVGVMEKAEASNIFDDANVEVGEIHAEMDKDFAREYGDSAPSPVSRFHELKKQEARELARESAMSRATQFDRPTATAENERWLSPFKQDTPLVPEDVFKEMPKGTGPLGLPEVELEPVTSGIEALNNTTDAAAKEQTAELREMNGYLREMNRESGRTTYQPIVTMS